MVDMAKDLLLTPDHKLCTFRLGMYHVAEVNGWTKSKNGEMSVEKAILWSSISGVLSGVAANPASVLKTRIQAAAHPSIAVGRQHKYNGRFF